MKKLIIEGNHRISGEIKIGGAKNSIVALIPATMLTSGIVKISNVPDISDVHNLIEIMEYMGSNITFTNETLIIDNSKAVNKPIPIELTSKLRASYYFMGALIGKYHHAEISSPGGCVIGSRPIDYHLDAFKKMGVNIVEKDSNFIMDVENLNGSTIDFKFPSVGATINIMLAAVLSSGRTIIKNAAMEPEIINVAELLISMGAKISGAGSNTIIIDGVNELSDGKVITIPDRIEAGTYIIIGSLLGDNLKIKGLVKQHLISLLDKLSMANVKYSIDEDSIIINKSDGLKSVNVTTTVYPGFPTDLGQPMSTFLTQCEGESIFEETIYENRLRHIPYLNEMGASINTTDNKAIIKGPSRLSGKCVQATDLRAGASMLVAGLIADGITEITNIEHLLRGYEKIVEKLNKVGADIKLIDE